MNLPAITQVTYHHEGKRFKFMLNLLEDEDCDKLIRTVRWATRNQVDIGVRRASLEEAVAHLEQRDRINS